MEMKNMNLLGIIGIIGAIILVVGVFLGWFSPGDTAKDLGAETATGWDVFDDGSDSDLKYTFVPLVALICGIISLVLMIVPTFMNVDKFKQINNILGLIALILAIVVVICGILFYTQKIDIGFEEVSLTKYLDAIDFHIGIGFWLVLVGGTQSICNSEMFRFLYTNVV